MSSLHSDQLFVPMGRLSIFLSVLTVFRLFSLFLSSFSSSSVLTVFLLFSLFLISSSSSVFLFLSNLLLSWEGATPVRAHGSFVNLEITKSPRRAFAAL